MPDSGNRANGITVITGKMAVVTIQKPMDVFAFSFRNRFMFLPVFTDDDDDDVKILA